MVLRNEITKLRNDLVEVKETLEKMRENSYLDITPEKRRERINYYVRKFLDMPEDVFNTLTEEQKRELTNDVYSFAKARAYEDRVEIVNNLMVKYPDYREILKLYKKREKIMTPEECIELCR